MAKIYIYVENGEKINDEKGKSYNQLWMIERKLSGNMQLCGATINGELRAIDFSVPTIVKRVPRGAILIPSDKAIQLWTNDSWYFGE